MDTLITIVSYLGVLGLGFYAGYRVSGWITETAMKELMREAGITDNEIDAYIKSALKGELEPVPKQDSPPKVQIRLEQVNGNLYCYEKATDQFLGQARNKEELVEVLTKRLGPTTLLIEPEDGAEYIQDGAVQ